MLRVLSLITVNQENNFVLVYRLEKLQNKKTIHFLGDQFFRLTLLVKFNHILGTVDLLIFYNSEDKKINKIMTAGGED